MSITWSRLTGEVPVKDSIGTPVCTLASAATRPLEGTSTDRLQTRAIVDRIGSVVLVAWLSCLPDRVAFGTGCREISVACATLPAHEFRTAVAVDLAPAEDASRQLCRPGGRSCPTGPAASRRSALGGPCRRSVLAVAGRVRGVEQDRRTFCHPSRRSLAWKRGWQMLTDQFSPDGDLAWLMLASTVVRAHSSADRTRKVYETSALDVHGAGFSASC